MKATVDRCVNALLLSASIKLITYGGAFNGMGEFTLGWLFHALAMTAALVLCYRLEPKQ